MPDRPLVVRAAARCQKYDLPFLQIDAVLGVSHPPTMTRRSTCKSTGPNLFAGALPLTLPPRDDRRRRERRHLVVVIVRETGAASEEVLLFRAGSTSHW